MTFGFGFASSAIARREETVAMRASNTKAAAIGVFVSLIVIVFLFWVKLTSFPLLQLIDEKLSARRHDLVPGRFDIRIHFSPVVARIFDNQDLH